MLPQNRLTLKSSNSEHNWEVLLTEISSFLGSREFMRSHPLLQVIPLSWQFLERYSHVKQIPMFHSEWPQWSGWIQNMPLLKVGSRLQRCFSFLLKYGILLHQCLRIRHNKEKKKLFIMSCWWKLVFLHKFFCSMRMRVQNIIYINCYHADRLQER